MKKLYFYSLAAISLLAAAFVEALYKPTMHLMQSMGVVAYLSPEELKGEIEKSLKSISDQIKERGEKFMSDYASMKGVTDDMKTKIDELLAKQADDIARLQNVEQLIDVLKKGGANPAVPLSPGQAFVKSESFTQWMEKGGLVAHTNSFVFGLKQITSLPASGGAGVAPDRQNLLVTIPERRFTIRDLLTPGTTNSNLVQYVQETGFTNNAAPVSETKRKPESNITYALKNSPVSTIAHFVKASKQILDDFGGLQSNIDGRLIYGLKLVEEGQLLNGSGVGNNLNGIYTQATAYAQPSGVVVTNETIIDRIRLALLQAELALYPATGIVLNPVDWTSIELTKSTTNEYIFANPQGLQGPVLWGRPVVSTPAMAVNTGLVGAFKLGAQIFDREQANIVISTENEDDFVNNMITIRCEERLALAVYRPEAFIKIADVTP